MPRVDRQRMHCKLARSRALDSIVTRNPGGEPQDLCSDGGTSPASSGRWCSESASHARGATWTASDGEAWFQGLMGSASDDTTAVLVVSALPIIVKLARSLLLASRADSTGEMVDRWALQVGAFTPARLLKAASIFQNYAKSVSCIIDRSHDAPQRRPIAIALHRMKIARAVLSRAAQILGKQHDLDCSVASD